MKPRTLRAGFAWFPYGGNGGTSSEHPALRNWFATVVARIKEDPRFEPYPNGRPVWSRDFSDTPITMTRNLACVEAQQAGVDVLVMIDSDQIPDLYVPADPSAKPFFPSSFDFLYTHFDKGPCMIVAPYCGPPPHPVSGGEENVYVFYWELNRNDWLKGRKSLKQYSRHEASTSMGFREIAAGPTGLMMLDMRALQVPGLPKPWFDYEWEDPPYCTRKASTEDVFFTRNASMAGVPVYCNWDSWAGHVKPEIVGKPWQSRTEDFREEFIKAAVAATPRAERTIELNVGKSDAEILADLGLPSAAEGVIDFAPDAHREKHGLTEGALAPIWDGEGHVMWDSKGHRPADWAHQHEPVSLSNLKPGERIVYPSGAVAVRGGKPEESPSEVVSEGKLFQKVPQTELDALDNTWESIPGWFDFQDIYTEAVQNAGRLVPHGVSKFVEIGSFLGRSTAFMATAIRDSGKNISFDAVDTWRGKDVLPHLSAGDPRQPFKPEEDFFTKFDANLRRCGLRDLVVARQWSSLEAANLYPSHSLDFVFIDGDHRYESVKADLAAWWPKVKPGGVMAGHDWQFEDVARAVRDFCFQEGLFQCYKDPPSDERFCVRGDSFVITKPALKRETANPVLSTVLHGNGDESEPAAKQDAVCQQT